MYLSRAEKDLNGNASNMIVFSYLINKVATENSSKDSKLREGGFGIMYNETFGNSFVCEFLHAKRNCKLKAITTFAISIRASILTILPCQISIPDTSTCHASIPACFLPRRASILVSLYLLHVFLAKCFQRRCTRSYKRLPRGKFW